MLLKKYETYTFSEFKELKDLSTIDRFIGNLKKNKKEYAKLVFLLAVFVPKCVFAETLGDDFSDTFKMLFSLLLDFAKYGCLFMGSKRMIEHMLNGANLKEASTAAIQYYIFYVLLQFYPKVFGI